MTKTENKIDLPAPIKSKFNIGLTEIGYQGLVAKKDSFSFNEDEVEDIKDFLGKLRKAATKIKEIHTEGKKPALELGRQWDAAKNEFEKLFTDLEASVQPQYAKLCRDIQDKEAAQERERLRIATIRQGIETNAVNFASKIAACDTLESLLAIERLINLEKGNSNKYQEFLQDAAKKFTELNENVKIQKEVIREIESLAKKMEEADKSGDDAAFIELQEKKELREIDFEQAKVTIQEDVINTSLDEEHIPYATQVFPSVKARRTTWKAELVDVKEAFKKCPDMLDISLNGEEVKKTLATLKDTDLLKGKTEYTFNGVRFFEEKTF